MTKKEKKKGFRGFFCYPFIYKKMFSEKKPQRVVSVESDHSLTIKKFKQKMKNQQFSEKNAKNMDFFDESIIYDNGEYYCIKCHFGTRNLKDLRRHHKTKKHQKLPQKKPHRINKTKNSCLCGKLYSYQSGLSKHVGKCPKYFEEKKKEKNFKKIQKNGQKMAKNANFCDTFVPENAKNAIFEDKNLFSFKNTDETTYGKGANTQIGVANEISSGGAISVTKSDLEKIIEQTFTQNNNITKLLEQNAVLMEKISSNKVSNTISYQNCGNKKMTINFYLNEKCKDAMNLSDFVNNLDISLEDLLYTQQHGYAEGISNIFVKHLQDLNPTERPIHCCNKKNMQFYVRDKNIWQKDKENKKIDKSIQDLTVKQIKHLKEWEHQNPNYLKDETLLDQWQQLIHEIMGSSNDLSRDKDKELIIKKLGKTVKLKENLVIKNIKNENI